MLTRALESEMRIAIEAFCSTAKDLKVDLLDDDDWEELAMLQRFLHNFHVATLASEGRLSSVDIIIETFDFLLEAFEEAINVIHLQENLLRSALNDGWNKLRQYYLATDRSPVYTAALVLRPDTKWTYIDNWKIEDWIPKAKMGVKRQWDTYKPSPGMIDQELTNEPESNAFTA